MANLSIGKKLIDATAGFGSAGRYPTPKIIFCSANQENPL